MKNLILIVLLIVLVAGGYYYYAGQQTPAMTANEEVVPVPQTDSETSTAAPGNAGKHAVSWKFESMGEDKTSGAPMTKVTVTWDGTSHDAGTYMGSCAELDGTNGTLEQNEVSGVLCWWAGAGDEVGIFNENGTFVIKHGEQQEPSAEEQGFRGNFKTLKTL